MDEVDEDSLYFPIIIIKKKTTDTMFKYQRNKLYKI